MYQTLQLLRAIFAHSQNCTVCSPLQFAACMLACDQTHKWGIGQYWRRGWGEIPARISLLANFILPYSPLGSLVPGYVHAIWSTCKLTDNGHGEAEQVSTRCNFPVSMLQNVFANYSTAHLRRILDALTCARGAIPWPIGLTRDTPGREIKYFVSIYAVRTCLPNSLTGRTFAIFLKTFLVMAGFRLNWASAVKQQELRETGLWILRVSPLNILKD